MTNKELEKKVKELLAIQNYFDFILAAKKFNKEYKKSDFYKQTHLSLKKVLGKAKIYYFLQMDDLFSRVQDKLDELNFDNVNNVINQIADVFGQENADITKAISTLKELM